MSSAHSLTSLSQVDWSSLTDHSFTASPEDWQDQVLYFVMIDRFSDGNEKDYRDLEGRIVTTGTTPRYTPDQKNTALKSEEAAAAWRQAGDTFCGGTLAGLQSKLGYLQRLGITTLWLSPVLKQAAFDPSCYHGYGIQNFLEVDPHFGTKESLRTLVTAAHALGMYVVMDCIVNHTGNVFSYAVPDQSSLLGPPFNRIGTYPVIGFADAAGQPTLPFAKVLDQDITQVWPDGAIWPQELQSPETFSRRGTIDSYEDPDQFLHGDFMKLKDVVLGEEQNGLFIPSAALKALVAAYQYWIAYADLDGYRLDAVKHMESGAVTYFVEEIQAFAQKLGKRNFYIVGEVAGGRTRAAEMMQNTGLNAIIAVDDLPGMLEAVAKGHANPEEYFAFFTNDDSASTNETVVDRSVQWRPQQVITMYDDHDQIRNGFQKARFAAGEQWWEQLAGNVLSLLVTTVGIPGIYYGSEQAFNGEGGDDNYIREAMFGGSFGPFRSVGRHCFNEDHPAYQQLSRVLAVRRVSPALRRGRQQLLATSGDGEHFGLPRMIGGQLRGVIAWLRVLEDEMMLCAMNTDVDTAQTVVVDLPSQTRWQCLFSSDEETSVADIEGNTITIPAAGFSIYQRS